MNPMHISDDLPRMLTGEASRDTVLSAGAHLRDCIDCQHELVSAVVAHSALTSARRFAPEVVSPTPDDERDADSAEARHAAPDQPLRRSTDRAAALPDLSGVFAQVRSEVDGGDELAERREKGRRPAYLIGAAAAAVLIGGGVGIYALANNGTNQPAGRNVAIAAFDKGTVGASARVSGGTIRLDASSLPTLTGKRYEVWLTNAGRTKLQPIGWVGNDGKATLTVPQTLMKQYGNLEVSVQSDDANDYTYSGTSVLRGKVS